MQGPTERIVYADFRDHPGALEQIEKLGMTRGLQVQRVEAGISEIVIQLQQMHEPPLALVVASTAKGRGLELVLRVRGDTALRGLRTVLISDDRAALAAGAEVGAVPLPAPFSDEDFWTALAWSTLQPSVVERVAPDAGSDASPEPSAVPSSEPARARTPPTAAAAALRALADGPIDPNAVDALALSAYADALATLIENPDTGTPLTIAINAPWGAGKSSLARMIERRLVGRNRDRAAPNDGRPHIVCWFNAWMHDDAPNLATAFAAQVLRVADAERSLRDRLLHPLPRALWSSWERRVFWFSIVVFFFVLFGVLSALAQGLWPAALAIAQHWLGASPFRSAPAVHDAAGSGVLVGGLSAVLTAVAAQLPKLFTAARSVASFIENPEAAANLGNIAEVREQLGRVLGQARGGERRFVVFVDDLERCRPPRAVDLLEVVNQLIDHPGVVVVIMADMAAVAACADIKYKELAERYAPPAAASGRSPHHTGYGRVYLQKIVQLQFDLPPHPSARLLSLLGDATAAARTETPAPHRNPAFAALRPIVDWYLDPMRHGWRRLSGWLSPIVGPYVRVVRLRHHPLEEFGPDAPRVRMVRVFGLPGSATSFIPALGFAVPSLEVQLQTAAYCGSLLLALAIGSRRVDRWERRVSQDRTRRLIDHALTQPDADPAAIAKRMRATAQAQADDQLLSLVRERQMLRALNDAEFVKEAYLEVAEHLPPYPRTTKRFVNHLRVLAAAAHARNALGGEPALTARHLARWILFKERWPLAAQAVHQRPDRLADLERNAQHEDALVHELERWHAESWDAADLAAFLRSGRVRLGDLGDRVVHLLPGDS